MVAIWPDVAALGSLLSRSIYSLYLVANRLDCMTRNGFSEDASISRRAVLGAVGAGSMVSMAGCLGYIRSNRAEGLIGAKSIFGRREDTIEQMMVVHEMALLVKDPQFEGRFGDETTGVSVDEDLHRDLELAYQDGIQYKVQTHLTSDDQVNRIDAGHARSYAVSRQLFNEVQVGDTVSFTVSRSTPLKIREYTEVTS